MRDAPLSVCDLMSFCFVLNGRDGESDLHVNRRHAVLPSHRFLKRSCDSLHVAGSALGVAVADIAELSQLNDAKWTPIGSVIFVESSA